MHEYIKYELLWKFSRSRVEGGLEERLKGGGVRETRGREVGVEDRGGSFPENSSIV